MKYTLYSIRDRKSHYGAIFMDENDEVAKRGFAMSLGNASSIVGFAPSDFDLYALGTFDSSVGTVVPYPVPEFVANAADMVNLFGEVRADALKNT